MASAAQTAILRRVGTVLVVVGLLDIGVLIYCMANNISYASSLNIFAVIAGLFLLRGNLGAAGLVQWFAAFLLAGLCALVLAWPVIQPISLTVAQLRLNPIAAAASGLVLLGILWLLFWVQRELSKAPVLAAIEAAGRKVRNTRVAASLGIGLVILLAIAMRVALSGESAARAKSIAQERLGTGYYYHVSSLRITTDSRETVVSANVTAWNDTEIRSVPVEWRE